VSAVTDHESAQRATMEARDALSALNALVAAGDRGVSGSDLLEAEAEVRLAERLELGALARAQAEQADAEAAAREAAIDALMARYRSTFSQLSGAIEQDLTSRSDVLTAAQEHESSTRNGLLALGITNGVVPGHGRLLTPDPGSVLAAVQVLAEQRCGITPTVPYPHLVVEPIAPFLPVGASVVR
jgi:hypothetical protein